MLGQYKKGLFFPRTNDVLKTNLVYTFENDIQVVLIDYKAQNGAVKIDSDRQNWRRRTFAGKPTINGFRR